MNNLSTTIHLETVQKRQMGMFHSTGMGLPAISLREQRGRGPGTRMKRHRCAVLSSVSA